MLDPYFIPVMAAAVVGGAGTGLLGVQIVGMRIPLLGVVAAHVCGLSDVWLMPSAAVAAMVTAVPLGMLRPHHTRIDTNVLMGVLFSLTMGLAFLGMGLSRREQSTMLSLLWGSLNFVTHRDLGLITVTVLLLVTFLGLFGKELRAILFSRELARVGGVHEGPVWTAYLVLAGLTLAVNLNVVGGLMIFSLLSNPAVAAAQLARSHVGLLVWSAVIGAASAFLGFLVACRFDLPTGASIVLTSSFLLALAVTRRRLGRRSD